MANGWTAERRAKHAAAIQGWRPWESSTGPRSAEGRELCSHNADKGRRRRVEGNLLRYLRSALKAQREALCDLADSGRPDEQGG